MIDTSCTHPYVVVEDAGVILRSEHVNAATVLQQAFVRTNIVVADGIVHREGGGSCPPPTEMQHTQNVASSITAHLDRRLEGLGLCSFY